MPGTDEPNQGSASALPGAAPWLVLAAGLAAGVLAGCGRQAPEEAVSAPSSDAVLQAVLERGALRVATRNAPTTFYLDRDGKPAGFEHDLAQRFAAALGVRLVSVVRDGVADALGALVSGEADLAAAGITRTDTRARTYLFGPPYRNVRQLVVCHRKGPLPHDLEALRDVELQVVNGSSYVERLATLSVQHPWLRFQLVDGQSTEQLLEGVWRRELPCTVADSNIVAVSRRYLPELAVAFPVGDDEPLAWALPPHAQGLLARLRAWFEDLDQDGLLAALAERYYGHLDTFDYVDVRTYRRRIDSRLPRYRPLFEAQAKAHGLPWTLLAAQAYQESHWDPKARSPTGVRGMMMLTQVTAKAMGVKSRLDPGQSIRGGARYLAQLRDRLPDSVPEDERDWFALAAYNVGMGHLRDARTLAGRLGRSPDRWADLKEVLPLLSDKRHYKTLPHGYARGTEPVRYVQRIREFQAILEQVLLDARTTVAAGAEAGGG